MLFLKWKNPGNVVSSPFFPKARKPRTITIIALAVLRRGCFLLFVTNFVNRNIISKLINIDVLEQKLVQLVSFLFRTSQNFDFSSLYNVSFRSNIYLYTKLFWKASFVA